MVSLECMVLLTSCKLNGCCFVLYDVQHLESFLNSNVFSLSGCLL